jgi:hypothetical protein
LKWLKVAGCRLQVEAPRDRAISENLQPATFNL